MTRYPRKSSALVFTGQFEGNVLGTFKIIRGFANLKDLGEVSVAYEMEDDENLSQVKGQQRTLDPQHSERIKKYLESGEQRFIPEIILSIRTDLDVVDTPPTPLRVFSKHSSMRHKDYDGILVTHGRDGYTVRVDREKLEDIRAKRLIRRVDGNHRLALAQTLQDDPQVPHKYLAPFCMILLGPPGDAADDYSESLIFHTINSTALPLESEHALKLILGQNSDFDMKPEKEFRFSVDLHFTRLLRDGLLKLPEAAQVRLSDRPLTCLRAAVRGLLEMDGEIAKDLTTLRKFAKDFLGALDDIVTRLEPSHPDLCKADFFIELAARVWKASSGDNHKLRVNAAVMHLEQLATWLGRGGLLHLKQSQSLSKQVLDIFNAVRTRIPKRVFLARWYPNPKDGEEHQKAKLRLNQIKQALKEIENENSIHLELVDMGTQAGGTFPIHPRMYEAIASADIILIDLTGVRPNVCVEAGFALRHHDQNRLIFIFQPTKGHKQVPFDLNTYQYSPFTDTGEIPEKIKPHIESILKDASLGKT